MQFCAVFECHIRIHAKGHFHVYWCNFIWYRQYFIYSIVAAVTAILFRGFFPFHFSRRLSILQHFTGFWIRNAHFFCVVKIDWIWKCKQILFAFIRGSKHLQFCYAVMVENRWNYDQQIEFIHLKYDSSILVDSNNFAQQQVACSLSLFRRPISTVRFWYVCVCNFVLNVYLSDAFAITGMFFLFLCLCRDLIFDIQYVM